MKLRICNCVAGVTIRANLCGAWTTRVVWAKTLLVTYFRFLSIPLSFMRGHAESSSVVRFRRSVRHILRPITCSEQGSAFWGSRWYCFPFCCQIQKPQFWGVNRHSRALQGIKTYYRNYCIDSAILKTVKSLYLSNGSTDRREIWHGDDIDNNK